jgi:hypothetical protein
MQSLRHLRLTFQQQPSADDIHVRAQDDNAAAAAAANSESVVRIAVWSSVFGGMALLDTLELRMCSDVAHMLPAMQACCPRLTRMLIQPVWFTSQPLDRSRANWPRSELFDAFLEQRAAAQTQRDFRLRLQLPTLAAYTQNRSQPPMPAAEANWHLQDAEWTMLAQRHPASVFYENVD